MEADLADQAQRLDDLQQAHRKLAAGGVFVQSRSVGFIIVGSLIATASSSLSSVGWALSALVIIAPALLWFLVSPSGRAADEPAYG